MQEAAGLLAKESIASTVPVRGQFVSSYFAVPKPHSLGKFGPFFEPQEVQQPIKKFRFRMEGLKQVRDWVQKDAWMAGPSLWSLM